MKQLNDKSYIFCRLQRRKWLTRVIGNNLLRLLKLKFSTAFVEYHTIFSKANISTNNKLWKENRNDMILCPLFNNGSIISYTIRGRPGLSLGSIS